MLKRLIAYHDWWEGLAREERNLFLKSDITDVKRKTEIKALSKEFLHKEITGCGWCLLSAHIELLKLNIEKMAEKTQEYALLSGTVLHDPIGRVFDKILTPATLSEELALYHIAFNKNALRYFTKYPADLSERVDKYLSAQGSTIADEVSKAQSVKAEILREQVVKAQERYAIAMQELKDAESILESATEALKAVERSVPTSFKEVVKAEPKSKRGRKAESKADNQPQKYITAEQEITEFVIKGMTDEAIMEAYAEAIECERLTTAEVESFIAQARLAE